MRTRRRNAAETPTAPTSATVLSFAKGSQKCHHDQISALKKMAFIVS